MEAVLKTHQLKAFYGDAQAIFGIDFELHAGELVGRHPWRVEALERTGAKVIAVEREGEIIVEFADDFEVQASDALFVCGSISSLDRYQKAFKTTSAA